MIDINGILYKDEEAKVSVFDSGFYYAFSAYETIFIKNSKPAFYQEHINRLQSSLDYIQCEVTLEFFKFLKMRVKKIIEVNSIQDGKLRIVVTPGDFDFFRSNEKKINSILIIQKLGSPKKSISMSLTNIKKPSPPLFPPTVKVTANPYSLFSFREAQEKGLEEGITLTQNGFVSEGSFCNLFWLDKEEKFKTPSLKCSILDGVTRQKIIESSHSLGYGVIESEFPKEELLNCKQLFISSSTRGLMPVSQLDHHIFDEGIPQVIQKVQKKYEDSIRESLEQWNV